MSGENDDIAYWRELALERQRELESLRARWLNLIDRIPDAIFPAFLASLDESRAPWLHEIDSMTASAAMDADEVFNVLDDLWRRIAANA